MKSFSALALLLLACRVGAAETDAAAEYSTAIATAEREIASLVDDGQIPGMSVAVVSGGKVLWAESFGMANLELQSPVRQDTRFRIGSISKPLAATAVALLIEDRKLDLERPISTYSPVFAGKGDSITLRHLLSHRSGIPHYSGDDFLQHEHYSSMTDAMSKFWDEPLLYDPGSRFSYSSFGFNLIGAVIERVTDMLFVDFVAQRITRPLDLPSIVPDRYEAIIPQRTAFYRRTADGVVNVAPAVDNSDLWPGGGYLSNTTDLARFGDAVINGDFLAPATLAMLLGSTDNAAEAAGSSYVLGWATGQTDGLQWIGHGGSHYGCMANLRVFPDAGIAIATLANINIEENPDGGTAEGFYALADSIAALFVRAR